MNLLSTIHLEELRERLDMILSVINDDLDLVDSFSFVDVLDNSEALIIKYGINPLKWEDVLLYFLLQEASKMVFESLELDGQ